MNVIRCDTDIEYRAFKLLNNCNDKYISIVPHNINDSILKKCHYNNFKSLKIDIFNKYDILDVIEYKPFDISNLVITDDSFNEHNIKKIKNIIDFTRNLDIRCYLYGINIDSVLDLYYMKELKIDMCLLDTSKIFNNEKKEIILCVNDELFDIYNKNKNY
tara:strand:- start:816 stop:1295 length:480 start_codon:yes stop_codon:yes gene_type:complete